MTLIENKYLSYGVLTVAHGLILLMNVSWTLCGLYSAVNGSPLIRQPRLVYSGFLIVDTVGYQFSHTNIISAIWCEILGIRNSAWQDIMEKDPLNACKILILWVLDMHYHDHVD